jgi:hypothetical protein
MQIKESTNSSPNSGPIGDLWVVVAFDTARTAVTRVDYVPVFANGVVDDVAYADTTFSRQRLATSGDLI